MDMGTSGRKTTKSSGRNKKEMKRSQKAKSSLLVTIALLVSCYLFIIFGLLFHTSAHPVLFEKYTAKYFLSLILFIIIAPLATFGIFKLFQKYSKKVVVSFMIFVLILVVFVSEFALRIKYKQYESTNYRATIDNFDPFLQGKTAKNDNLPVNSLGFRGEEIQENKPENTFRIVVLGGSTVLNREVAYEKNAVRLLEKKLRQKYPQKKIEVINAGQSGYTSEHSLIQYMFKIRDLQPDLLIMWHGINDMGVSCTYPGQTYGSYKSDYSHAFGPLAKIVFDYFRPQPVIQIKLVSADFLLQAFRDNLYSDVTKHLFIKRLEQQAKNYRENKNTIFTHEFPSLNAYQRNLDYFILLTKEQNTPLILGNQPNIFIQNPTIKETEKILSPRLVCIKDNKNYSLESLHYGVTLFNNTTKKIAEENDVLFVDLDNKVPKNLSHFVDSVHYTEKGNEVIAQELFKKISDNSLIRE
jgi:lysophospholipase L1-like esterase